MKTGKLIRNLECEKINFDFCEDINSLCLNHKDCKDNSAFFCIKGNNKNGEDYAEEAVKNGAKLVVSSKKLDGINVSQIVVSDVRKAMLIMSMNLYDNPQKKLRTIGIVGTNGKTTICSIIHKILNNNGIMCGKIGTFGAEYGKVSLSTNMTTPDTPVIFKLLDDMVKSGIQVVCMEISAHAIYYKKADFKFDILVFTNCTHEHLDFFENFETYKEIKESAFTDDKARIAVVNGDDPAGIEISALRDGGVITYGIKNPSDIFAIDIHESVKGLDFVLNLFDEVYKIHSPMFGKFNVYNLMASAVVCAFFGLKTDKIAMELCNMEQVEGRMEQVCHKINVFIDYAHTPDGLKQALLTLKKIKDENSKLICVFGCGGNRDREKRSVMGEISGEYADFTIITSDNPRFEDEDHIITQIEKGIRTKTLEYITISDRKSAIEYAVQLANAGDYILIAGKGAEKYQESMGVFKRFSDKETAIALVMSKYDKI